ncbi:MAG: flagellin FliC [Sandaracinus sp.]|nr:flagellin FliC [Sandaracinus sp.]MCB9632488.1 flagellin FliC [Sandaracinus sp.]
MGTFSVLTNVPSLNAQHNLKRTQTEQAKSMGRLSSGMRINRAGDDAAGLAISENLKAQIRSLGQAERNANDGISLLQTAEGSMNEISGILTRMRELAMQSSTDTVGDSERAFVQQEFSALVEEIDRIANVTEFNGTALLDGTATGLDFQVGIRDTANDRITVGIADMRSTALGTSGGGAAIGTAGVDSKANAQAALDVIDQAINDVSAGRAGIGAAENRLQVTIASIDVSRENLSAANSRIRDTDVAEESAAMTRASILMQAGVSVLAQANQTPQMALNLLG